MSLNVHDKLSSPLTRLESVVLPKKKRKKKKKVCSETAGNQEQNIQKPEKRGEPEMKGTHKKTGLALHL